MNKIKTLLIMALISCGMYFTAVTAQAQTNIKLGAMLLTEGNHLGANLGVGLNIINMNSVNIGIEPGVVAYIPKKTWGSSSAGLFEFKGNVYARFKFADDKLSFAPFIGPDLLLSTYSGGSNTDFGINLGADFIYSLTDGIGLYAEGRYIAVTGGSIALSAGVVFHLGGGK